MAADAIPYSVLIVDDEKEACANLKNILIEYVDPNINIAGIAHNTADAEKQINKLAPDAVFLDIEMPNENAFHFLDRIAPFDFEVIFVTAYDEYAIRAFKLNAIDYILKPISITELTNAVEKLKQRLTIKRLLKTTGASFAEISNQLKNKIKHQKITLKEANNIAVVDFKDIYFVEAQGSYARILFLKDGIMSEMTVSSTLSDYEAMLPPELFYRIHKSYLINCGLVKKIVKDDVAKVILKDNTSLPISRRRFMPLLDFLNSNDFYHD